MRGRFTKAEQDQLKEARKFQKVSDEYDRDMASLKDEFDVMKTANAEQDMVLDQQLSASGPWKTQVPSLKALAQAEGGRKSTKVDTQEMLDSVMADLRDLKKEAVVSRDDVK